MPDPFITMACLGLAAAFAVLHFQMKQAGYSSKQQWVLIGCCLVCFGLGLAAANVTNWFLMNKTNLPLAERIATSGITFYPGMLAFVFFLFMLLWVFRQKPGGVNLAIPALLAFHACARIGCFLAGCCYGKPGDFSFLGIHFDSIPTQLIESLFCLIMLVLFIAVIKKRRVVIYLYSYAFFRFFIEFLRGDKRGELFPSIPLSPSQQIAVMVVLSMTAMLIVQKLIKRNQP